MNWNKQIITFAVAAVLSTGAAFSAQEQGQRGGRGDAQVARKAGRLANALNLTDAQKEQAKAIHQRHREANSGVRAQLKDLSTQIRAARQANNTAEAQRLAALREPLLAQAHQARQAQMAEFKALLTPEQQTKLEEMSKSHRGGKRGFRK